MLQTQCISRMSADELRSAGLLAPPISSLPNAVYHLPPAARLAGIQDFISSFTYNYISGYHYNVRKQRPFSQIMKTAKQIIHEGLPIKCIEACFLGAFLTCRCQGWARYPLGFKSRLSSHKNAYRCDHEHIWLFQHDEL